MLREIGSIDKVPEYIGVSRQGRVRLMGFGHRVYKNYDPRARIIKQVADEVFEVTGRRPAARHSAGARADCARRRILVKRKLYPNVDFYSGIIYQAMGFPGGHVPGTLCDSAHRRLVCAVGGNAARSGAEDRAPPTGLSGRVAAGLCAYRTEDLGSTVLLKNRATGTARGGEPCSKRICLVVFIGIAVAVFAHSFEPRSQAQEDMSAFQNNSCVNCHSRDSLAPRSFQRYTEWHISTHKEKGVGCDKCHSGDPTKKDQGQAHAGIIKPSDPKSRLYLRNLPETCNSCHPGVVSSFVESAHYQKLKSSGMGPVALRAISIWLRRCSTRPRRRLISALTATIRSTDSCLLGRRFPRKRAR